MFSVCFWSFVPLQNFFYSDGNVNFTDEALQILTYNRHSRPLISEGSLACHTYCDRGDPFIIVMSEDPCRDISICCRALGRGAVTT